MRSKRSKGTGWMGIVLLAVLVLSAGVVRAQTPQTGGSISGTVHDPSGAVIPAIAVTARNVNTGVQQTVQANAQGVYSFTSLAPGSYVIEVVEPGFKPFESPGLTLQAGMALEQDITLAVGAQTQQVTVTESTIHVETQSSQMREVISSKKIVAVPLNGRSFTDLLPLQAGIVPISSQAPNSIIMSGVATFNPSGDQNPGNASISGQRESANGFMVNGSDVEEDLNMGTAILPVLDAIDQFRVLTNNFDAQYGNYSGGQVIVTTKSGTNHFHGDLFEFLRNTSFDAKNYFSPTRAKFNRNQFGGTLGGPILSNKVFFFTDYQGTRTTQGVGTGLISVPSLADRSGNLSDLTSQLTGTVNGQYLANLLDQQLGYAPGTITVGEPYYTTGCTTPQQCVLPGATLPENHWSAPAQNLLQYIPEPNQPGNRFFTSAFNQTVRDDKGAVRIDANTHWGNLTGYYFLDDYALNDPYPQGQGGASVPGFNALSYGRAQLLTLSDVKTIGATAVNEFHFSYMRDSNEVGTPQGGVGPTLASQGFVTSGGTPTIFPVAPAIQGIENIVFNNFTMGVDITGMTQHNNTFQWDDDFSKVIGAHTLKFGAEVHFDQINDDNVDSTNNGTFIFSGTQTGSDYVDFLLGLPFQYLQGQAQNFYMRNRYLGFFGQDSWQMRSNLTLNYGLRWDLIAPWSEKYNQLQALVPGQQSVVYPGAPQGLLFPGDAGVPSTIGPTRYTNFAPRIGLAYAPSFQHGLLRKIFGAGGVTSIRIGYGMFYTAFPGLSGGILYGQPPYGFSYTSPAPPLFNNPFITASDGTNLGQRFPTTFPPYGASPSNPNTSVNWGQFEPISGLPAFATNNQVPYAENYMLSIERQIGTNLLFSISYVGSQDHHLLVIREANPGNPALCLSLSQPSEVMPGTPTCGPGGESGVYYPASGGVVNGTRGPLGAAYGSDSYQQTIGNSSYNALEANLRYTGSQGTLLIGYTYSKSLDDSSNLGEQVNPIDPSLSRAVSAFDMTHNFVASYTYNLPFARLFHRSNRLTNGWSISGTTRFSTGLPVTLYNNTDTSLLGTSPNGVNNNYVDTPNFSGGPLDINTNPRNGLPEFNTSLFSLPPLGQVGNVPRRFFYGPGIDNWDLALYKVVRLSESKTLQLRWEAFNVFNHAQFYGPAAVNGNISSPDFGQVVSAAAPRIMQLGAKFSF